MLILTRRINEKLIIDENVTVTVLSIKGHQVRIGIDAPRDVKIHREEVYQRILKENKALNGNGNAEYSAKPTFTAVKPSTRTLSVPVKR